MIRLVSNDRIAPRMPEILIGKGAKRTFRFFVLETRGKRASQQVLADIRTGPGGPTSQHHDLKPIGLQLTPITPGASTAAQWRKTEMFPGRKIIEVRSVDVMLR